MTVIDVHSHVACPRADELVREHHTADEILARDPYLRNVQREPTGSHAQQSSRIAPQMRSADARLSSLDDSGIDVQVLAPFVRQNYYWTDGALGAEVCRAQNETIAAMTRTSRRFVGVGSVPMQDARRMLDELHHGVRVLGLKGIQIAGNVEKRDLDDPRFDDFFAAMEEEGAVVVIHPDGFSHPDRFDEYFLVNTIGNPLETTTALARLILGGVLDRHPQLRLCAVHGGGYLPFGVARLDHAWHRRPECRAATSAPPSAYLERIHFDSLVYDPAHLRALIDRVGSDRVMLGTDSPFDMAERDPLGFLARVEGLSDDARLAIQGGTAARLFGIE